MGLLRKMLGADNDYFITCPKCENLCNPEWNFCDKCGTTLIAKKDERRKRARAEQIKAEQERRKAQSNAVIERKPAYPSSIFNSYSPQDFVHIYKPTQYSSGINDISLMENLPHLFNLTYMTYVKFEDTPYNQYLFDGNNQALVKELVSFVLDSLRGKVKLIAEFTPYQFEFEPRPVRYWDGYITVEECNQFCWLEDTRFTRTGKISKNAYNLHFYDKAVHSNNEPQTYGNITLQGSLIPNKGRVIQWRPKGAGHFDMLVIYFKMVNNQIVVSGVERDGRNVLNR